MNGPPKVDRTALGLGPGVLLAGVAGGLAFPILPSVGLERGLNVVLIGGILAANRLGRLLAGPLVGAAADRHGGRPLMLAGLLGQLAVMSLYLLAVTTPSTALFFLLGRLLHGPCSAAVVIGAQTLAICCGGQAHGGRSAGTVRAATSLGLPLGVLLGGFVSGRFGAAAVFEVAMAALLLATAGAFAWAPRAAQAPGSRATLAARVAALADRRLAALGALNFAVTFSALGIVLTAVPLLTGLAGKTRATLMMGALVVSMGAATLVSSRLVRHPRAHAALGAAGATALPLAFVLLALTRSLSAQLGAVAVLGLAAGALSASVVSQLAALVAPHRVGAASGWLQLCGDLGGVCGPLAASALLTFGASATWLSTAALMILFPPVAWWLAARSDDAGRA